MDNDRITAALGFAMKAGECLSGDFACRRAVRDNKALAVALDEGISGAARERYVNMCQRAGIPCVSVAGLGRAIGRGNRMIAAVTGAGFAEMIKKAMDD